MAFWGEGVSRGLIGIVDNLRYLREFTGGFQIRLWSSEVALEEL